MKSVLFLYFSQTGQTEKALDQLQQGLGPDVQVQRQMIQTKTFPFPWNLKEFFRLFVNCHNTQNLELRVDTRDWGKFDLIVIGYQTWFLSPSWPMQSFMRSHFAHALAGKKVFTLMTCRNLWYSATRWMQNSLKQVDAVHLGQATVCETSPAWTTFITTFRWLRTGRKNAFWIFPEAGIPQSEFQKLQPIGRKLYSLLANPDISQQLWWANQDRPSLRIMDTVGIHYFKCVASLILRYCPRPGFPQDLSLLFMRLGLLIIILVVVPIAMLWDVIAPYVSRANAAQKINTAKASL